MKLVSTIISPNIRAKALHQTCNKTSLEFRETIIEKIGIRVINNLPTTSLRESGFYPIVNVIQQELSRIFKNDERSS